MSIEHILLIIFLAPVAFYAGILAIGMAMAALVAVFGGGAMLVLFAGRAAAKAWKALRMGR